MTDNTNNNNNQVPINQVGAGLPPISPTNSAPVGVNQTPGQGFPQQGQQQPVNPQQSLNPQSDGMDVGQAQVSLQQDDNQQSQPTYAPSGPETAPIPSGGESAPRVEYGYERLKEIDQVAESIEQQEQKETLSQPKPEQEQQKQQSAPPPPPPPEPPKQTLPKFFGYGIPANMIKGSNDIKQQKGKGDPNDAKTWLYVLLDRLLKKQSTEKSA